MAGEQPDNMPGHLSKTTLCTPAAETALRLPPCDTAPAQDEVAAQGRAEHSPDGRGGLLEQVSGVLACHDVCPAGPVEASRDST